MATTAIDSLRGILNGFRDLNSKGIYTMNGTETDLLRQILIEVQALSIGGGIADGSVTTAKLDDEAVATAKLADNSVATAKIIDANVTPAKLSQPFTSGTSVASTSGTAIDFTSIPSWVKRITLSLAGVSTNGTSILEVRIGSGSVDATGYDSACSFTGLAGGFVSSTTGFVLTSLSAASAAASQNGSIVLLKTTGNTWQSVSNIGSSSV